MSTDPVVIVAARRTPIGAFQGALSDVSATELGAMAVAAAVADSGVEPADFGRVLMGCVLPAGLGQAPARQAALGGGLPEGVPCATVNKMCGSGMEALVLAHDMVVAGSVGIAVAGGLESMTNAPYLMPKARRGYRMGHQEVLDHMFYDGLQDTYEGHMMGHYAEATSQKYGFTREDQDAFAIESVTRATRAAGDGSFDAEIVPVTVTTRRGEHTVSVDEVPGTVSVEKIPNLRPAFAKDGTVTAASSSSISDGASALVIMRASEAEKRGLEPLARIGARGCPQVVAGTAGLDPRRRGPLRDQRGLCLCHDGRHERRRHRSREGQRQRRRLRTWPSDRSDRRTHYDDVAARNASA